MAQTPGRNQIEPMERLIRIVIRLTDKGALGIGARQLATAAGYPDDSQSDLTALRRDIKDLRSGGWNIANTAEVGDDGHYVLLADDNRLALLLTPGERVALQQSLTDASSDVAEPPAQLAELERAVERHCLVHFTYKAHQRTVHPHALHSGPSGWMLRGREADQQGTKEFAVTRMGDDVAIDQPGTGEIVTPLARTDLDPMTWLTDPVIDVALSTTDDHLTEVQRVLSGSEVTSRNEGSVGLTLPVTNRAAFRSRLYELGVRVRVLGPPEVRAEILEDLRAIAQRGR